MVASAYLDGLRMLARRELSEAHVRQRLSRRGHEPDAINAAVDRLTKERAIDDVRVAEAMARTEATVKRRGRLRVRRQIEHAGIAAATASRAVDEVFSGIDDQQLIEAALAKRLRDRTRIADDREFQKLYRFLIAQGFESDRILRTLAARRGPR